MREFLGSGVFSEGHVYFQAVLFQIVYLSMASTTTTTTSTFTISLHAPSYSAISEMYSWSRSCQKELLYLRSVGCMLKGNASIGCIVAIY